MLPLCGSGVTMSVDGRLRFVTTVTLAAAEMERDHEQLHPCPCRDAYATEEVVRVTNMREESGRCPPVRLSVSVWPQSRCALTTRSSEPTTSTQPSRGTGLMRPSLWPR